MLRLSWVLELTPNRGNVVGEGESKLTGAALANVIKNCPPELRKLYTHGWHVCAEAKCPIRLRLGEYCFYHTKWVAPAKPKPQVRIRNK